MNLRLLFINAETVIPAKFSMPRTGAWYPRMDEMAYTPHPPPNLPLEGGGKVLPSPSGGGQGWGWGGRLISNEAGIQSFQDLLDAPVSGYGAGLSGPA